MQNVINYRTVSLKTKSEKYGKELCTQPKNKTLKLYLYIYFFLGGGELEGYQHQPMNKG